MDTHYTPADVAEALQIPEQTVRDKAHRHEWPHSKISPKVIRFSTDDIDAIYGLIRQQPRPPARSNRTRNKQINDLLEAS